MCARPELPMCGYPLPARENLGHVYDVTVGSSETKLQFVCVRQRKDGGADLIRVRILSTGLEAEGDAYEHNGYGALAAFFEGMAADWRGWSGERSYFSLEGHLEITAIHDGHVRLAIRLTEHLGHSAWKVQAHVVVDPGEDLARAASDVRALVSGPASS